jgi:arginase
LTGEVAVDIIRHLLRDSVMPAPITVIGAPSNIGIRPYDDGTPRGLDQGPGRFRQLGLPVRLKAEDAGDVRPPPYRDFERPPGRCRNEAELVQYTRALAERVAAVIRQGRFPLVLGGDCSIVLGCLLGAGWSRGGPVGLTYLDAHADFATPAESRTGSAASMCLAMAVGRGDTPLARLSDDGPLVRPDRVALVGRRSEESWYGHPELERSGILNLQENEVRRLGFAATARAVLDQVTQFGTLGFWIHLDADVVNPLDVSAVDSPEPGGPRIGELGELLRPLVQHPAAIGLELTIYDPVLDPDRSNATRLADLLGRAMESS